MGSTGRNDGLFAYDPFTLDMVDHAIAVRDAPVARDQLDQLARIVLNPDVIDPKPFSRRNMGLFGQEIDRNADGDALGNRRMLE